MMTLYYVTYDEKIKSAITEKAICVKVETEGKTGGQIIEEIKALMFIPFDAAVYIKGIFKL